VSRILFAEFPGAAPLREAARGTRKAGYCAIDAFAPFAVEGLAEALEVKPSRVRIAMFIGGVGTAALCYGLEWWTAVINYPINSGGRPLNAWPAFMLFPFAFGIFIAAVAGLTRLFFETGLPRLHDALFAVDGFERVSQDAFLLALDAPPAESDMQRAYDWLRDAGAIKIWEVKT
jgi:Alternative complex III, ActD subunit